VNSVPYTYPFALHYESGVPSRQVSSEEGLELDDQIDVLCVKSHVSLAA
jgi:hypothetical protein